jgi:hypothetical protein
MFLDKICGISAVFDCAFNLVELWFVSLSQSFAEGFSKFEEVVLSLLEFDLEESIDFVYERLCFKTTVLIIRVGPFSVCRFHFEFYLGCFLLFVDRRVFYWVRASSKNIPIFSLAAKRAKLDKNPGNFGLS